MMRWLLARSDLRAWRGLPIEPCETGTGSFARSNPTVEAPVRCRTKVPAGVVLGPGSALIRSAGLRGVARWRRHSGGRIGDPDAHAPRLRARYTRHTDRRPRERPASTTLSTRG